jgi:peptide chain release factor 2
VLLEWARGGEDVLADLSRSLDALSEQVEAAETKKMLSGEHDLANAIITIHPGAGGVESQDWAEMLLRMYLKWAEKRGFKRELLEYQPGEEAGLKSVTFTLSGEYAFGLMAAEDLRIDTYRSSGAGGQHVNVTDSAVRITHLPTGIVTSCQNERSQHKNKDVAMKVLKAKLYDLKQKEQQDKLSQIGGAKKDIAFGSQIRSYVLQPYQMIKDHRTKLSEGQVDKVLNGDLDAFIKTYLMQKATGTLGQASDDDEE